MSDADRFLFVVCQVGAERALKTELAREWPCFRLSYSRPGFVTFKVVGQDLHEGGRGTTSPQALSPSARGQGEAARKQEAFPRPLQDGGFDLRSTFARAHGFCLGKVVGHRGGEMAAEWWSLVEGRAFDHLHVWQRDPYLPGQRGFEPGITPLAREVARALTSAHSPQERKLAINRRARSGQIVLDCVVVDPGEWWAAYHQAAAMPSRFPAGICLGEQRVDVISRAYWKIAEALTWSQFPVRKGDRCVEIGSSPGGASQALLDAGLLVLGVDPAKMDERVLSHPNFTHAKKRAADMKRREFQGIRWLMADSNVAPKHTLDTVESIVTHRDVSVRGMLLTLKLSDWALAESIPSYLERVRSWGYGYVRARQLAYNRQEICISALRNRSMRRSPPWKKRLRKPRSVDGTGHPGQCGEEGLG